jgi:type I restriction enzyme, S subunit
VSELNLPPSWVMTSLEQMSWIEMGQSPDSSSYNSEGDGLPFFQGKTEFQALFPEIRKWCAAPGKIVERGDILLSIRAPVGPTNIAPARSCIGRGLAGLRGEAGISQKYFFYFLRSIEQWLSQQGTGSTFAAVSGQFVRNIDIPIAPSAEQNRIVEKLEDLLTGLDAGVAELKRAQKKLAQYRQSLLKAAVEGTDTGRAFPKVMLGDLVATIGQGWSPKCEHEAASNIEQWAVMKTTAIQPLAFDGSHNKVLPKGLKPREHLELKSGDLLVTRAGPRNRVGVTCLVRTTRERLILCDKAYRIRCDETKIDPSFLELVLNAPHMVQRIDELKTGISDSGLNLTQDRFFTLEIPLPALEVQRAVIDKIHHQVELIQNQENSIEISLKQSTAQRQNILKAAFSGQLVPQDPSDEPASELLERIRAERAAKQAVKKPRGRKVKEAA